MNRLIVYHTSDVHARRGFGPKLARLVEPGGLLVDCGDSLAGSSTVYREREPVRDDLTSAPYAAQAVGNREFHYIYPWFAARARALPFPLVCSNVVDTWGRALPFARDVRVLTAGVQVRLLALLAPQYRTGSPYERLFGWRFLAPDIALAELLERPGDAQATIVLSHLGLRADRALAAAHAGRIDAIVGGHSHDVLRDPEIVAGVPISHAGAFARYCGRLELTRQAGAWRATGFELLPLLDGSAR